MVLTEEFKHVHGEFFPFHDGYGCRVGLLKSQLLEKNHELAESLLLRVQLAKELCLASQEGHWLSLEVRCAK